MQKAIVGFVISVMVLLAAFAAVPLIDSWPFICKYGVVVAIGISSAVAVRCAEVAIKAK